MNVIHRIRIVYQPEPLPEAPELEEMMSKAVEEETVEVWADSAEDAVGRAMQFATIEAGGRLVRYFDEQGIELFGSYRPKPDSSLA